METFKSKHIVIGLVVGFILFMFCRIGNDGYFYQHHGATTPRFTPTSPSYRNLDGDRNYSNTSTRSHNPINPQRHEILQAKVKGYREQTYWGEQHPTYEKVRDMDDAEFDLFIDEVGINDADVYWGVSY